MPRDPSDDGPTSDGSGGRGPRCCHCSRGGPLLPHGHPVPDLHSHRALPQVGIEGEEPVPMSTTTWLPSTVSTVMVRGGGSEPEPGRRGRCGPPPPPRPARQDGWPKPVQFSRTRDRRHEAVLVIELQPVDGEALAVVEVPVDGLDRAPVRPRNRQQPLPPPIPGRSGGGPARGRHLVEGQGRRQVGERPGDRGGRMVGPVPSRRCTSPAGTSAAVSKTSSIITALDSLERGWCRGPGRH